MKQVVDHLRQSSVTVTEAITKVEDLLRKDIASAKGLELLNREFDQREKTKIPNYGGFILFNFA